VAGAERQRAELVEGEAPVREVAGHVLDAVESGVLVGINGLFPGAGALEGDPLLVQDLTERFPADLIAD
jgi:hypothetical protein